MSSNHAPQVVLRSQATLGEGPLWDPRRKVLWWIDIEEGQIHRFDPVSGRDRLIVIGCRVGAVACREKGGLLVAYQLGIAACDPDTGELDILHRPEDDQPANRFNDGKCDPDGRLWAGTMNLAPDKHTTGALYSLDPQQGLRRRLSGVGVSNGIAWTANGGRMYYVDSMIGTIDCFDFNRRSGTLSNRRIAFRVPPELGVADGMTIDADDKLWVAFCGGWCVARIDPVTGELLARIRLPVANVTSCTFGGAALDELYITTAKHGLSEAELAEQPQAGNLFMVRPGVTGTAPAEYRG